MNLKVLHIGKFYPPHAGGMETHVQALATRQKKFLDAEVIVANDSLRTCHAVVDRVPVTRVASLGVVASMPLCPTLAAHLRSRRPDVVHLHLPNPGAAAAYLMSRHKGRLVVTHHSDILGRKHLRKLCDGMVRRVMEQASVIIVTSLRYAQTSIELAPFLEKCRVVPLGLDPGPRERRQPARSRQIRDRFGGSLVVAIGRLVPYKGFEYLIRAMALVAGNLVIVGSGPLRGRLENLVTQLQVADRVHLLGNVDDLQPFYEAADIVVVPSITRAEAFGMVQLEAMARGRPVINTNLDSGVPEVSLHGKTGLTVPPADESALAEAIDRLLGDAAARQRFGTAARLRVLKEFDIDTMVRRTVDLYQGIETSVQQPAGEGALRRAEPDRDMSSGSIPAIREVM